MAIKRITTNLIKDSDIATVDIANNAITAAKITDGNITTAKLADLSVTAGKLAGTLDLTGKTITVATATTGDNDTSPASTAFVQQEIAALVDSSPDSLNTLNELAAALGDDASFSTTVTNSIALKAPLDSPVFSSTYTSGQDETLAEFRRDGGAVAAKIIYADATTDMEFGTTTSHALSFITGDTRRVTIDSLGNVGIGTSSPSGYRLNVSKGSAGNIAQITDGIAQTFIFRSDSNTLYAGNANNFSLAFVTNNTEKMTIDSSGRVGIGNNNPQHPLHFGERSQYYISLDRGNSTPGGNLPWLGLFNNQSIASATYGWGFYDSDADGSFQIWNRNGNTTGYNAFTIKRGGNVGIGETSPETSLHIKNAGNSFLTLERSGTTGGTGKFGINMEGGSSQQTTMGYDDGGKLVIGRSSDPATMAGFNNDFILKGGFVGIKTLDPQVELHVTGNANISGSTTSGGVITANHIIRSDAGHNTARVEAVYDDNSAQYDSNILMWVSEPGYTYDSGGIGVNIHESGHYYGRKYDNDYAVFMRFQKSDGAIQFGQNQGTSGTAGASQTETLKITANGTLRLATTGGIGFGTINAADTLDDYEEGNFTPTFVASGGTAPSSQTGTGQYTKIGDVVHLTGQIVWNGAGSGGSNLYIPIPFNLISDARAGLAIGLNSGVNYAQDHTLHLVPEINTNVIYIVSTHYSVSGHTHLSYSNISNTGSKIFSFSGSFHTRD